MIKNIDCEIFGWVDEMEELENQIQSLSEASKKLHKKIQECCRHPDEYIVEKSLYISGSYYDTDRTEYWNECQLCGCRSETMVKNHGW